MYLVLIVCIVIGAFLLTNERYKLFYFIYKTAGRDLRAGYGFLRVNLALRKHRKQCSTVVKLFLKQVAEHPEKVAFLCDDQEWTFRQVDEYSNRIAHYFKEDASLRRGDVVALLLDGSAEYVCLWLGLAKIGVLSALLNHNITGNSLLHSLSVANATSIIYGPNYAKVIREIEAKVADFKLYQYTSKEVGNADDKDNVVRASYDLKEDVLKKSSAALEGEAEKGGFDDKLFFIYTSGTTGLPKAAVITNARYIFISYGIYELAKFTPDDILYCSLPLYHTSGGILGVGHTLINGVTVAIRAKFSASNFWKDCIKYRCTGAQYIGEICRYLLAYHANSGDGEIKHRVRFILGNGMRPQIWTEFVRKFKIDHVFEVYGSTEGNSSLINIDNTVGSVGFVPRYAERIYPLSLVRCDEKTGEPLRNANGFCERCKPGQTGVFIGAIRKGNAWNEFEGYADRKATEKKILNNVFVIGDSFFNSGDVLVQDELGYYYFKDRTGDTFRWKGENVSTSEVEAIVSNLVDYKDAIVYGVEIPGTEGKAGMVAIVDVDQSLDLGDLYIGLKNRLPSYAMPIFVRILLETPMTGTFKLKKTDLVAEGFDINKINDTIYFLDATRKTYVKLEQDIFEDIRNSRLRL